VKSKFLLAALFAGASAVPAMALAQTAPAPPPAPQVQPAAPAPAAAPPAQGSTPPATNAAPGSEATPAEDEGEDNEGEIVVTGQRERGAVQGNIPPENQLNRRDIRAYGASSISDLLDAIAPQTASTRGRGGDAPVILLNGRRISSFAEIRDIPPEAIDRVDIFPEEVALKYGYRADQRVVNFVLRRRFRAVTTEANASVATEGGRASANGEFDLLRIQNTGRFQVHAEYQHASSLLESERNVIETPPSTTLPVVGPADPGASRTLLPETNTLTLNTVYNRNVFGNVSATLNGRYQYTNSESLLGLPSATLVVPPGNSFFPAGETILRQFDVGFPLQRDSIVQTGHVGLTLNGDLLPWRWSLTSNYDRTDSLIRTRTGLDVTALQQSLLAGDPAANPFGDFPATLVGARPDDRAHSLSRW
jgi:iron complex outermembrane receptor protein